MQMATYAKKIHKEVVVMCDDKFLTKLETREFIQGDTFVLAF